MEKAVVLFLLLFYLGFSFYYYLGIYLISLTKCTPIYFYGLFLSWMWDGDGAASRDPHLRSAKLHSIGFVFLILSWYQSIKVELSPCGWDWGGKPFWLRETGGCKAFSVSECRCEDLLAESRSAIFMRGAVWSHWKAALSVWGLSHCHVVCGAQWILVWTNGGELSWDLLGEDRVLGATGGAHEVWSKTLGTVGNWNLSRWLIPLHRQTWMRWINWTDPTMLTGNSSCKHYLWCLDHYKGRRSKPCYRLDSCIDSILGEAGEQSKGLAAR